MKLMGSIAAVSAFALSVFTAGAAAADCKQTCNATYMDCGKTGKNQVQCLNGWRTCKMQCSGGAVSVTPVAGPAAQPKGGAVQKAAVKH